MSETDEAQVAAWLRENGETMRRVSELPFITSPMPAHDARMYATAARLVSELAAERQRREELEQERRNLNDALQAAADAAHQRARERVKMQAEVNDWIRAAMRATMPHEFGIAFDPTSPMAWAESRRHALDMLLTERDALKAQLATARADVVREKMPDEALDEVIHLLDGIARDYDPYDFGLPVGNMQKMRDALREKLLTLLDGGTA